MGEFGPRPEEKSFLPVNGNKAKTVEKLNANLSLAFLVSERP